MVNIDLVTVGDTDAWLALAKEVEPLFGPMVGEESFIGAIAETIAAQRAYCIRSHDGLAGVIVISGEGNEIEWFAVSAKARRKGYGRALLAFALRKCDPNRPVTVQTFDGSCSEGAAARKLYTCAGFVDAEKAGLNPAGLQTVIMRRCSGGGVSG